MKRSIKYASLATILFIVIQSAMGGLEKPSEKAKSRSDLYAQVELFADALSIVRSEYVDDTDSRKLMYGAMKGMLESLDDYSQFLDPDEYREIKDETKGEFGGIGVEISLKEGILTIITPMVGTPAEAAGIKAGDKIIKIDGKITKDIDLNDAVKLMRGKPGTTVTLTVWRESVSGILELPVKRELIKVNSIKRSEILTDNIGYIRLVEFQENTIKDLDDAIKRLKGLGADSLILDLRNNPGGLLDGAVSVAERFLPEHATIVSIKAKDQTQSASFKSSGKYADAAIPLVLIVNEGSASASEIVAGAIKDNKRGIVVGAKTFGKASVQSVIPLKDGSAIRFTTAYYITPGGRLIKDEGITPDVVVGESARGSTQKATEKDLFEKADEEACSGTDKPVNTEPAGDNQIDTAVNLMKAIRIYKAPKGS